MTNEMTIQEAILAYIERFGKGPPIREMDDDEALAAIQDALEHDEPMSYGKDQDIPEDART